MPRTLLAAPTVITRAGVSPATPVAMDAVNGNALLNDGGTEFEVTNSDTASHTITISPTQLVDGQSAVPIVKTIAAGNTKRYANYPVKAYGALLQITANSALLAIAAYRNSN
jgi:hypothetical protein